VALGSCLPSLSRNGGLVIALYERTPGHLLSPPAQPGVQRNPALQAPSAAGDRRAPIVRDIAAGEAISGMKELGFPYASRAPGRICGNDLEPYAKEFVFLSAPEFAAG